MTEVLAVTQGLDTLLQSLWRKTCHEKGGKENTMVGVVYLCVLASERVSE